MARPRGKTVGQRIKEFRTAKGMTASELAVKSKISKSYLSELESAPEGTRGPWAETVYRIAKALGVAMSDLLGKPVLLQPADDAPPASLLEFAKIYKLPEADVHMLANIRFRGEPPKTADRWLFIYQAIRNSAAMDG